MGWNSVVYSLKTTRGNFHPIVNRAFGKSCHKEARCPPLLSNIVLDELDWELQRRDHRFVRSANDCNIRRGAADCCRFISALPLNSSYCSRSGSGWASRMRAARRWRRNASAEWRLNTIIGAAQPATDGQMNLRYLVRYVGLLRPFSAQMDRSTVRVASQHARKKV